MHKAMCCPTQKEHPTCTHRVKLLNSSPKGSLAMAKQGIPSHVMTSVLPSSPLFAFLNFMDLLKWYNPERFLFLKKETCFTTVHLTTKTESQRPGQQQSHINETFKAVTMEKVVPTKISLLL